MKYDLNGNVYYLGVSKWYKIYIEKLLKRF